MKRIAILGSTGSIGKSTLSVLREHRDKFRVVGLTAHSNLSLLKEQVEEFKPDVVAVSNGGFGPVSGVRVLSGHEGLCSVASYEGADFVISAIVGAAGLLPTLSAIRAGKAVGLANKETLVMAGPLVLAEAKKSGSVILPVDSEHSAVFQCLDGRSKDSLDKIVLTASGGPFLGRTRDELKAVTPDDALKHPSWSMGSKITVDSATLMNKGLEVIEAAYLFGVGPDNIDVVIHPQSIVHSMVTFKDGCSVAQMSVPDMRAPIAYALSYPERLAGVIPAMDLPALGTLTFMRPDRESFPCLGLAYVALREGGAMPVVLNAANEVAVSAFLDGNIGFNDIPAIIEKTMAAFDNSAGLDGIEAVLRADSWARAKAEALTVRGSKPCHS